MTPTTARTAAAVSVLGVLALAGCAGADTDSPTADEPTVDETAAVDEPLATGSASGSDSSGSDSSGGAYADGTYTAEGSYATPDSVETISVTVTLDDDVVIAVEVTGDPSRRESEEYQGRFIGGISDEVVGVAIDDLSVSRVAGSSLTSGGFNDAIEQIKADAAQ